MKTQTAYLIHGFDARKDPLEALEHPDNVICLDERSVRRIFADKLPKLFEGDDIKGRSFEECMRACNYRGKATSLVIDGEFPCYSTGSGGRVIAR